MVLRCMQNSLFERAFSVASAKQPSVMVAAEFISHFEDTFHVFKMTEYRANAYAGMISNLLRSGLKITLINQMQHRFDNKLTAAVAAQAAAIRLVMGNVTFSHSDKRRW